jgi:hypothetical protein
MTIIERMQKYSCRKLSGTIADIWDQASIDERIYMLERLGVNYYLVHFGLSLLGSLENLLKSSCSIREEARQDIGCLPSTALEFLLLYTEVQQFEIADRCRAVWGVPLSALFDG